MHFSDFVVQILSKTNRGGNLAIKFSANSPFFQAALIPAVLPWKHHIAQSN